MSWGQGQHENMTDERQLAASSEEETEHFIFLVTGVTFLNAYGFYLPSISLG
jgi:hypothetical protein